MQLATVASDEEPRMSNKPAPPLVREVRRWQEGKAAVVLGSKAGACFARFMA